MRFSRNADPALTNIYDRFSGDKMAMCVLTSKLNSIGSCSVKRLKFVTVVIRAMDQIGYKGLPLKEFVDFVNVIFEKIKIIPDSKDVIPLGFTMISKRRLPEDPRKVQFLHDKEEKFKLPHSVRQQIIKCIEPCYILQLNEILKKIRFEHRECEGNLISIIESVAYGIMKIKQSGGSLSCISALVHSRYKKLKEGWYWKPRGATEPYQSYTQIEP